MRNIHDWNEEYGLYHKNRINKIIHWICIPLIIFSLFGLLSLMSYEFDIGEGHYKINTLGIFICPEVFSGEFFLLVSIL